MPTEQMDFSDVYIERLYKETEEVIAIESVKFLDEPLDYLNKHRDEFIYIESSLFESIHVEAISLEVNDVFRTYDVLLGLKRPKKQEAKLKDYLNAELSGGEVKYNLLFDQKDGLWSLNFTLNFINAFNEKWSLKEAYVEIYQFLFQLDQKMNG